MLLHLQSAAEGQEWRPQEGETDCAGPGWSLEEHTPPGQSLVCANNWLSTQVPASSRGKMKAAGFELTLILDHRVSK